MGAKRLTVLYKDIIGFSDYSIEAENFIRDSFGLPMNNSDDYLYIGLYKPFSRLYFEMSVANTSSGSFTGEYWNGTAWTSLEALVDYTNLFNRSGFMEWELEQTDWAATTVNNEEQYWVRFRPSVNLDPETELIGASILFSEDKDLLEEFPEVLDFLSDGKTSYVHFHQSTKKEIVQEINNRGFRKLRLGGNQPAKDVTEFDLLEQKELSQAAKYKALEKIFFHISDNTEDKYYQRYLDYKNMFIKSFDMWFLTIDLDDDGEVDVREKNNQFRRVEVVRV